MGEKINNRLHNLDYLRGLAAFGIMIYHYCSWEFGDFTSDTIMERIGIYGVAIFYVLSGITLFHVYFEKLNFSKESIFSFFKRRIFRIFPLLWFINIISLFLIYLSNNPLPSYKAILVNFTGLFGIVAWWAYFSTGVWSIGNELVFYLFFPFFVLLTKLRKISMLILSLFILVCYLYFAFIKLNTNLSLSEQWRNYINPLNQVFLFLGGFLIGYFFNNKKIQMKTSFILLILGLLIFIFYPSSGNSINIVTNISRLVFSFSCFIICLSIYKITKNLPQIIHQPLSSLGEMSYSVYLIHPIIWKIFNLFYNSEIKIEKIAYMMIITLIISYFVYTYFEKVFMKLGRNIKFPYLEK